MNVDTMKISYSSDLARRLMTGFVSFLTAVIVTYIFDREVKWALASAIGIGTFIASGF